MKLAPYVGTCNVSQVEVQSQANAIEKIKAGANHKHASVSNRIPRTIHSPAELMLRDNLRRNALSCKL